MLPQIESDLATIKIFDDRVNGKLLTLQREVFQIETKLRTDKLEDASTVESHRL